MVYEDRAQAGRILAERLLYLRQHSPVVVGVANGGVVAAREIATILRAPLDALMVRKIPAPGYRDLAMGAVGEGAVIISNHDVIQDCRITPLTLAEAAHREHDVIRRQRAITHRDTPALTLTGRVVVLADDGIVTGATIKAAVRVLRARGARLVILAVPVAPAAVLTQLDRVVDQVICLRALRRRQSLPPACRSFPDIDANDVATMLRDHSAQGNVRARLSPLGR